MGLQSVRGAPCVSERRVPSHLALHEFLDLDLLLDHHLLLDHLLHLHHLLDLAPLRRHVLDHRAVRPVQPPVRPQRRALDVLAARRGELRFEPGDLFLEFPKHRILRVLVDLRFVLDVLRAVGVAQRRERLVVVPVRRSKVCNHHSLRVAAE